MRLPNPFSHTELPTEYQDAKNTLKLLTPAEQYEMKCLADELERQIRGLGKDGALFLLMRLGQYMIMLEKRNGNMLHYDSLNLR